MMWSHFGALPPCALGATRPWEKQWGGRNLGMDDEAGEEWEQLHSCPSAPQYLRIQKLGGDIPKDFYPKRRMRSEKRVGCTAEKLLDGHRGA